MDRETYLEERRKAIENHVAESQSYDKLLITLATGAFGLSFTFIKLITPNPALGTIWILAVAWASLIISILGSLFGRLFSQNAHRRSWENLDLQYKAVQEEEDFPELKNGWNKFVRRANWTSAIFFVVGVIMLTVFATINIKIEAQMTDKKRPSTASKVSTTKTQKNQTAFIRDAAKKVPQSATEAPSAPVLESKPRTKPSKPKE